MSTTEQRRGKNVPTISTVLPTGEIIETIFDPDKQITRFVVWSDGASHFLDDLTISDDRCLVPYSPSNNLIQTGVLLLPSEPEEYGSEETLLKTIRSYLHRYVDVDPLFEQITSYYILLSWVYDGFNELPYLRVRGEPGSGKTRFLQIVGSLCYKPIFASGASSISPIFRILDATKGTLVIDESDFRMSDEKAEMVKILNNGNVKGFPVLRSEVIAVTKEVNPRAFHVFGPKIVATRGPFQDRALESRFLSETMGHRRLREDIPINLPDSYKEEALHLRNQLLLFRFRTLNLRLPLPELVDRSIEPRLNQIFVPLLSIIQDPSARKELAELARSYSEEMVSARGQEVEADVLGIIQNLWKSTDEPVSVKSIAAAFVERHGSEYERSITPKWIGHIIRNKLGLRTLKTHGVFIIPTSEKAKLDRLFERYGIPPCTTSQSPEVHPPASSPPENIPLDT